MRTYTYHMTNTRNAKARNATTANVVAETVVTNAEADKANPIKARYARINHAACYAAKAHAKTFKGRESCRLVTRPNMTPINAADLAPDVKADAVAA